TNNALVLGAEIDSELERARQLRAGIEAEEEVLLPLRDDSGVIKAHEEQTATIADAADIRREAWAENARGYLARLRVRVGPRPGEVPRRWPHGFPRQAQGSPPGRAVLSR